MPERPEGASPTSPSRGPLDRRILRLSPALRSHAALSGGVALLTAAAVLAQAEAVASQLPRLIAGDAAAASPLIGVLLVVGAVRGLGAWAVDRSASRSLAALRRQVRARLLDRVEILRVDQRSELGPARAAALATRGVDALGPWVRSYLPALTVAAVVPVAAGLRILGADLLSALILAAVVPLIPLFMVLIGRATEAQSARQWEALSRLATRFLDVLTGLATLRLFGRAEAQVDRVRLVTERYREATIRTLRVAFLSALVLELLATLSVAIVAVSLGIRLIDGDLGLESALVVLLLAPECLLPLRRVSAAFHASVAGSDAVTELDAALALPSRPHGDAPVPAGAPSLEVRGVALTDPERGARLAPVSLSVAPGEMVAVVGPSGAGKSTLVDIVRGALAPDEGVVRIAGTDVADLAPAGRASVLAWSPQRPQPLGVAVAASAAMGSGLSPTDPVVGEVLGRLGMADLADADPSEISGGERRRLALARSLVRVRVGCPIVLADEPTAQLDRVAAQRAIDALRAAADGGAAVLVVTHDEALAGRADRRIVLTPAVAPGIGEAGGLVVAAGRAEAHPTGGRREPPPLDAAPVPDPVAGGAAIERDRAAPDPAGAVRWLLAQARPRRGRLLGAQALGVLTEVCTLGLAGTAAWLVVRAAERPSFADLAVAAVAVRAFGLGKGVLRYGERLASHDATLRLLADLRATVVARLVRLAPTGLPRRSGGELMSRLVDDVDRLQDLFLRVAGPSVASLSVALGAAAVVGVLEPAAGAVLLAAVLVVGVVLPAVTHRLARRRGAVSATIRGRLAGQLVALVDDVEELAACGAAPEVRAEVEATARTLERAERRPEALVSLVAGVGAAAPALVTAAVVAVTGPAGSGLSGPALGVVVLLPIAVMELLVPLAAVGEVLARVEAAAARVQGLLLRDDPVTEPDEAAPIPARGDLALDALEVAWPGEAPRLGPVDLAIAEGRTVALVGPSGSGKSTLAMALVRFLAPIAGRIEVGGVDAAALGGDGVRQVVTWCPQDPWFAESTLADNLRIARPTATDDELRAALATVHLDTWCDGLPDGLATRLGRDATTLSGGERQRLALARALLGGHRAVVLDEPTAHLDEALAREVRDDLLAATADRAVLLLGHGPEDVPADVVSVRLEADAGGRWRTP